MTQKNEKLAWKVLDFFKDEIKDKPASIKHHMNMKDGLKYHLQNVLFASKKYFPDDEQLHFFALVHDIGKAREYTITKEGRFDYASPSINHIIHTIEMLHEFGIKLTPEELNALQFHHGGWSLFKGNLTKLAIKLHFCDMMAVNHEIGEDKLQKVK